MSRGLPTSLSTNRQPVQRLFKSLIVDKGKSAYWMSKPNVAD